MRYLIIICFACLPALLQAQYLTGIGTKWGDSFTEWDFYFVDYEEDEETELEGELKIRWPLQDDWTEWDYELGGINGNIRLVWKNDPSRWQLSSNGEIVTIRRIIKNDPREWRITDNTKTLTFRSRWGNNLNEWHVRGESHGLFRIFTNYQDDPREWIIEDELDEEISMAMKVALVFVAVYNSTPRN